jgi:hypothetical protein
MNFISTASSNARYLLRSDFRNYGAKLSATTRTAFKKTISLGRVTFGPEIGYRFQAADGTYIEPHASITGIWDFDKSDALVLGDEVVGTDEFRGKLQAGILFTMPSGYTVRARGSYDGIGSDDFEAYGGQLWVNLPLN